MLPVEGYLIGKYLGQLIAYRTSCESDLPHQYVVRRGIPAHHSASSSDTKQSLKPSQFFIEKRHVANKVKGRHIDVTKEVISVAAPHLRQASKLEHSHSLVKNTLMQTVTIARRVQPE